MAEERSIAMPGWLMPLALLLTALLAALPALCQPDGWIEAEAFAARAWPGTGWLLLAPAEGARAILGFRLLLLGGVVLLGGCVARLARSQGGGPLAALAAGLLTVASASALALLQDPAGALQLVAALAFVVAAHACWREERRPTTSLVTGLVATVASAGALLPGVLLVWATRPRREAGRSVLPVVAAAAAVAVVVLVVARGALVGLAADSAVRLPAAAVAAARAETLADVLQQWSLGGAGVWSGAAWIDSWQPSSGAGVVPFAVGGIVLLVAALRLTAPSARLALCGLLAAGSAVALSAAGGTLPLISVAAALPGLACMFAALAAALPRGALAAAALLLLADLTGVAGPRAPAARLAASVHPELAARSDRRDGTPLARERAVLAAANGQRRLAAPLEWELGGELLRRAQRQHGDDAALEWIERWLALRPATAPSLPALEARQVDLLLRRHGPERAAAFLASL
ncbi:MAG: hypothetical protein FJ293_03555, partial [Planctomycetes bacterium]|nr:hypothetical protein [Planctomycetota bacterium]